MEFEISFKVTGSLFLAYVVVVAWRLLNWVWIRPKKLEKMLLLRNKQDPNPSAFLMIAPTVHAAISKHGKKSFVWLGPKPLFYITDPDHIKEVLSKIFTFQKPSGNPLTKLMGDGLTAEGDKWTQHRKIMKPAFQLEKLKVIPIQIPLLNSTNDIF